MSSLFRTFIVLFFMTFAQGAAAEGVRVHDIRVGIHDHGARLVIEGEKPANITTTDGGQGVVSVGRFTYTGKSPFVAAGSGVDKLVVEPESGLVILSFARPMRLAQKLTLPSQTHKEAQRFVFDFLPLGNQPVLTSNSRVLDPPQTLGQLHPSPSPALPPVSSDSENRAQGLNAPVEHADDNLYKDNYKILDKPQRASRLMMVVIDAGHGGKDPGARAVNGIVEKHITLATAKSLAEILRQRGHTVHLTRDSDIFIPLRGRVKIAQKHKADLFISLHADSMGNGSRTTRGASVYTLSDTASDKETAALATRENQVDVLMGVDLSHEDKDVANILIDLAMRDTMNQSKKLANTLVMQFKNNELKMLSPPHRFAGFAVLKAADIPSILIELGFLSSPEEAAALNNPNYRMRLAQIIADTVDDYNARHRPQE